ncbi:MAG: hypothetical protein ACLUIW_01025 [Dysosmobacter welbionis]
MAIETDESAGAHGGRGSGHDHHHRRQRGRGHPGEVRALPVYGPGGYVWMPESGAAVLVIKGGPGGEEQCVAGQQQALIPEGMGPGEVYLFTPGGNSVYLRSGGEIELQGKVRIQGSLTVNGEPYAPCES